MGEGNEQFHSAEAVYAAAQLEFQVDLNNRGAVMAKAHELNDAARKVNPPNYSQLERLDHLLALYDKMSGKTEQPPVAEAA